MQRLPASFEVAPVETAFSSLVRLLNFPGSGCLVLEVLRLRERKIVGLKLGITDRVDVGTLVRFQSQR